VFSPGQKIICIDDRFSLHVRQFYVELPRRDAIYTVRDLVPGVSPEGSAGEVAIYLNEIRSPDNRHGIERGFNAERFAPLNRVLADAAVEVARELEAAFA
jgi:hypothetical protein